MSAENFPQLPNNYDLDHSQADPGELALRAGAEQLAANIARIIEQRGADQVSDYLASLVTDTSGEAPAEERRAAFAFIAAEQKVRSQQEVLGAGNEMLAGFNSNNQTAEKRIPTASQAINNGLRKIGEAHEAEVGRPVRAGDARAALRGHESVGHQSGRLRTSVEANVTELDSWSKNNQRVFNEFGEKVNMTQRHERALDAALKSLEEGNSEQDLGRLFDKSTSDAVAEKLVAAIDDAHNQGLDPAAALADLVARKPDMTAQSLIMGLKRFGEDYANFTRGSANRVNESAITESRKFAAFRNRGSDYQSARSSQALAEVYRTNGRVLGSTIDGVAHAVRQGQVLIETSKQKLQEFAAKTIR